MGTPRLRRVLADSLRYSEGIAPGQCPNLNLIVRLEAGVARRPNLN